MSRNKMAIGVLALVFAAGCDKSEPAGDAPTAESKSATAEKSGEAEKKSDKGKSKFAAAREAAKIAAESGGTAAEGLGEAAAGKKNWEMSVEGVDLATVSGGMVMAQTIGDTVSYKFAGEGGMHTVTLKGVKKHEVGEFEPYMVQFLWTEKQYTCNKRTKEGAVPKVTIKKDGTGIRGEVSGKVWCMDVSEGSKDEGKLATVKGYFVD